MQGSYLRTVNSSFSSFFIAFETTTFHIDIATLFVQCLSFFKSANSAFSLENELFETHI